MSAILCPASPRSWRVRYGSRAPELGSRSAGSCCATAAAQMGKIAATASVLRTPHTVERIFVLLGGLVVIVILRYRERLEMRRIVTMMRQSWLLRFGRFPVNRIRDRSEEHT